MGTGDGDMQKEKAQARGQVEPKEVGQKTQEREGRQAGEEGVRKGTTVTTDTT